MDALTDADALGELLSPFAAEEFLEGVLGRTMLHVRGAASKFDFLFSWDELNRLLAQHRLEPPRLRLAQKGVQADALRVIRQARPASVLHRGMLPGLLDLEALNTHLRSGATLIVDAVDEASPRLAELRVGLARRFEGYPQINAYITFRAVEGFGLHWDDHDVLVLQVAGRKAWRVFAPTYEAPLLHDAESDRPPTDDPVYDGVLAAGDILYLPRGWWHAPRGVEEPSLHLTIALPRPTGADLLDWLVNRSGTAAITRRDLPQFARREVQRSYARELKAALDRLWTDDAVEQFLEERRSLLGLRSRPSLPFTVLGSLPADTSDYRVRFNGIAYSSREAPEGSGATTFTFAGNTCEVDAALKPVLTLLLGGCSLRLSELQEAAGEAADRQDIETLLLQLLAIGCVSIDADKPTAGPNRESGLDDLGRSGERCAHD